MPIIVVVAGVVLILVGFLVYAQLSRASPSVPGATNQDTQAVAHVVTSVPPAVYDQVGAGAQGNPLKTSGAAQGPGEPTVYYVGAASCPFCAAERWALVAALARFGQVSGLALSSSSSTDVFPNTPTFSLVGTTLTSPYVKFVEAETQDRDQKPLQSPTAQASELMTKYDAQGSIPFVMIGDLYYRVGAGYDPSVLNGMSWTQIAADLSNPNSTVSKAIIGTSNVLSAAICRTTGGQPQSVCGSVAIKQISLPGR